MKRNLHLISKALGIFLIVLMSANFMFAATYQGKLNLNTASVSELIQLPYVGKKKANAILQYRNDHGFKKVADVMNVKGISEKMFSRIKSYLILNGESSFKVSK